MPCIECGEYTRGLTVKTDREHLAAAQEAQYARQLHAHPDRVEQRCAWAVTRDGAQYVATQTRGDRAIDTRRISGEASAISGLIPESLQRMIRALSSGMN